MAKYFIGGGTESQGFDFIDDIVSPDNIEDFLLKKQSEIKKGLDESWHKEYKKVHPDRTTSLSLMQSVKVNINKSPNFISLVVTADPAWKFVDKGVKGRLSSIKAPKSPFKFKKKNLPREVRKQIISDGAFKGIRGDKQAENVGYLVGRTVMAEGIKPIPFVSNYINDKFKKKFNEELSKFIAGG